MPIFHDGQLIGRLDAKTYRAEKRLEAKRIFFEPWFARGKDPPAASWGNVNRDAALCGVAEALHALAKFVGADHVSLGEVAPAALAVPMKRALSAARPATS
jgi:uncharacterized protein YcaQ